MSRNKRLIAVTGIIMMVLLSVSGCKGYDTLEEYYNKGESEKTYIDEIASIKADNMEMSVSGNEIHYDVVYEDAFDPELREYAAKQIEAELESMKPVFSAIAKIIEDEISVKNIEVKLSYQDKSGYVLYEDTISSKE